MWYPAAVPRALEMFIYFAKKSAFANGRWQVQLHFRCCSPFGQTQFGAKPPDRTSVPKRIFNCCCGCAAEFEASSERFDTSSKSTLNTHHRDVRFRFRFFSPFHSYSSKRPKKTNYLGQRFSLSNRFTGSICTRVKSHEFPPAINPNERGDARNEIFV